jgi:hypothetical protein
MALNPCPWCSRESLGGAAACRVCGAPLERPSSAAESADQRPYRWPLRFFLKHWNGEYSLARSYWLNTFFISLFAPGLGLVLFPLVHDRPARFASAAALLVTALGYAAWFWAVRGTWLSATRHASAGGGWGGIAKGMIVLGAMGIAAQVTNNRHGFAEHWATMLGKQAGPRYVIRVSRDRKSLKVIGGMNDGATDTLTRTLNSVPSVATVTFNSGGGWIREGHLMAAVISQRGLATHVDGECSSACTLAFLAGKERTLGPNGRIGFHRVRSIGGSELQKALDITRTQSIYQSAGLPNDFIDKVMATRPDKVWYPTATELRAANVITAGAEWNEARADLTRQFRDSLGTNLKGVRISDEGLDALLDCEVSDYIKWLNTTDCPYLFDKATTSLAGHLEEQRDCLDRVGSAAKLREIDLACTKRYLPNDYSIYSDLFTNKFAARFDRHHPFSPSAQRVGACVATRYLTELTRAGCKPMNLAVSTEAGLFATDCVDKLKPTLERQVPAILRGCEAAAAP